jgi:hypothetical protein
MKKLIVPAILGIAILTSCEKKQNETVVTENAAKTEQVAENHDEHATQDEHSAEKYKIRTRQREEMENQCRNASFHQRTGKTSGKF